MSRVYEPQKPNSFSVGLAHKTDTEKKETQPAHEPESVKTPPIVNSSVEHSLSVNGKKQRTSLTTASLSSSRESIQRKKKARKYSYDIGFFGRIKAWLRGDKGYRK